LEKYFDIFFDWYLLWFHSSSSTGMRRDGHQIIYTMNINRCNLSYWYLKSYGTTVDTRTMEYSRNMSKYSFQINRIWEKPLKETVIHII
jgi:hypothetical protein